METADPLSDEELEELDHFLLSDATHDEAMDISMLDGFLTALAVGPNTLPPGKWMPLVWGENPVWESQKQAERMMSYVFRHLNSILFHLREEPDTFEPLLYEREHEGKVIPVIDEWCTGFIEGMSLDEESWLPLLESEEGDELLFPIMLYGTEAGLEQLTNNPVLEDRYEEFAAALGDSVVGIMEWWLPARKAKSTVRRDQAKIGRNDPCPCGSGRMYKQCCGGPKTLH